MLPAKASLSARRFAGRSSSSRSYYTLALYHETALLSSQAAPVPNDSWTDGFKLRQFHYALNKAEHVNKVKLKDREEFDSNSELLV